MTQDNLLDDVNEDNVNIDQNKNYLEELVGEGKKFKTTEDLAKGKFLADSHINILERRFDELRNDYKILREEATAGASLKEYIDQLSEKQLASRETNLNPNEDKNKPASYDPKEIDDRVISQFEKLKQNEREQENIKIVRDKLNERFGNNYKSVLKEQAESLGLTDEYVNKMARETPALFIKTFDLEAHKVNDEYHPPINSNVKSSNFAPKGPKKRTWSYYLELKKQDPMAWYDSKIAVQMDKDSQALGKDFYDV